VSVLLPHSLDYVIENLPLGHSYTADQLIDENTVLPFFAPFLESTRYQNAKSDMRGNGGLAIGSRLGLHKGIGWPNRLRHCCVCDAEKPRPVRRDLLGAAAPNRRDQYLSSPSLLFGGDIGSSFVERIFQRNKC
jgi:hypothetical protein